MKNLTLVFCLILIGSVATYAQSYTETVWNQIQNSYESASDDGYSMKITLLVRSMKTKTILGLSISTVALIIY